MTSGSLRGRGRREQGRELLIEVVVIAVVLSGIRLVVDVPYPGPRGVDTVGALLSVIGMGGILLGILVWQEGGEWVGALLLSLWLVLLLLGITLLLFALGGRIRRRSKICGSARSLPGLSSTSAWNSMAASGYERGH